jgi:hypothetical protein
MSGWAKVREHVWVNELGTPVLKHTKYLLPDGSSRFPWQHTTDFGNGITRWFGGDGKDYGIPHPLIYPRDVFEQADRRQHIYVVEGEADVDAAFEHGLLAVTAGAAGAFGREHALLFKGWGGRVSIVRDNDLPGAWSAAKAYDALRAVGIPAGRLRVARGRCTGARADLRDHLEAGYTVEDLISEPIATVRRLAARATSETFAAAGYPDGVNPTTGYVWVSPSDAAQLNSWKPVSS